MTSNGLLLVDKPSGLTSHDVVMQIRRILGEKKIGHAGTLDPMATGLLVIAVGAATRLLRFSQSEVKHYFGRVRFGVATDSLDADGVEVARAAVPELDVDMVNLVAKELTGELQQVPPMVSALKVGGRRLHELARQGIEVDRESRSVTIDSFTLTPTDQPEEWDFDVVCSSGTYVRVLLVDLCERLATVGHLVALRRLSSGDHLVENAMTMEELEAHPRPAQLLRPLRDLLIGLDKVEIDDVMSGRLRQGQRVFFDDVTSTGPLCALDSDGDVVAVLSPRGPAWQPEVVLAKVTS